MRWLVRFLVAGTIGYALSGTYMVNSDEVALVRRFGKLISEQSRPGLHIGLPWGLDMVQIVQPNKTHTVSIGKFDRTTTSLAPLNGQDSVLFLTADQNLVIVEAIIHYTIDDPATYYFDYHKPEGVLRRMAEVALTETVGTLPVDTVWTTSKSTIAARVFDRLEQMLAQQDIGIALGAVSPEISIPPEVEDSFNRAASARSDRRKLVLEAERYRDDMLARAEAESQRIVDEMHTVQDRSVDSAESESTRFNALLSEYTKHPKLTLSKLYLETMNHVIPKFESKLIIDQGLDVDITTMQGK